ncbi:FKBP-type peptidyl-prolyl cis-trans isomerase [Pseudomonas sp. Marseille-QA0332]
MFRYLAISLVLVASSSLAAPEPTVSQEQELAYSVGASLGQRLRQEMPGLPLDSLVEGLRQAYQGQPLKLEAAQIEALLQQHEEQAAAVGELARSRQLEASEATFMADERARPGMHELEQGVLYSELVPGNGAQPTAGGRVQVRYTGRLPDGTVFDQNQQPQWFRLDAVIAGWRIALPRMKSGAKWRLVIPSALAYGAEGAGDLIAPYTPLVFEVELLAIDD